MVRPKVLYRRAVDCLMSVRSIKDLTLGLRKTKTWQRFLKQDGNGSNGHSNRTIDGDVCQSRPAALTASPDILTLVAFRSINAGQDVSGPKSAKIC